MKKCDYCGINLPVAKITAIENGKVTVKQACENCVKKETVSSTTPSKKPKPQFEESGSTIEDILGVLFGKQKPVVKTPKKEIPKFMNKAPCPHCDITLEEIFESGKFGCGWCYEHFEEELLPIAMVYQEGRDKHVGKVPQCSEERKKHINPEEYRKLLLLRKAKAVEMEKYEEAAEIAEELKKFDL